MNAGLLYSAVYDAIDLNIPESFKCPLSMEIFRDPVSTLDGHCYERAAIENWLMRNNTSPVTGAILQDKTLVPAITLRKAIEEWKEGIMTVLPFSKLQATFEAGAGKGHKKLVHRARLDGQPVAVFELVDPAYRGRLAAKIVSWRRAPPHPCLARLIGVSNDTYRELVVAEYAPQGTLPEALQHLGPPPPAHTIVILQQVALH